MGDKYRINPKRPVPDQFDEIIGMCGNLPAGDTFDVYSFGEYDGLDLHIYKDTEGKNTISIATTWEGKWVDDTTCACDDKWGLWNELKRIWNYRDFERD